MLFAIRNGGFSGAIMPQNIVVGEDAEAVAEFVAEHAGSDATEPPGLSSGATGTNKSGSTGSTGSTGATGSTGNSGQK